jgi:hypothetical protein
MPDRMALEFRTLRPDCEQDQISEKSSLQNFNSKMSGLSGPTHRDTPSP